MVSELNAVSPIDGRYHSKTRDLSPFFSELALFRYRVFVEIEYFIKLSQQGLANFNPLTGEQITYLRQIVADFDEGQAQLIKAIETRTNHDVKAVEYYIKEKLDGTDLEKYSEYVHFGLTSQDVNNTAIPLSLREGLDQCYIPELMAVIQRIDGYAQSFKHIPLLSRTHGQPASPTTMGKEFAVFAERLGKQLEVLRNTPISAKFGGATGSYNAHVLAYPDVDWKKFGTELVQSFGLAHSYPTTQIDHYDFLAAVFDAIRRIHVVLIDFSRDVWQYISMEFFKQKIKANEVGSSAMPHKVNPIDFENAEGNLGIANAIFDHLSNKLPVSRLQRDLTDSTVLRNIGVPIGHGLIALKSLQKGLDKLLINEQAIQNDLDQNWAVVAEAIQTLLRREQVKGAYEMLKELTRTNEGITKQSIQVFIDQLDVSEDLKIQLRQISPSTYLGYANQ